MGLSQVTIDIGNIAIGIELDCTSEGSGLIIYGASLEGTLYNLPLSYHISQLVQFIKFI